MDPILPSRPLIQQDGLPWLQNPLSGSSDPSTALHSETGNQAVTEPQRWLESPIQTRAAGYPQFRAPDTGFFATASLHG